jgi:hypothetical protein
MALKKIVTDELFEVIENGCVQVRTKRSIMEDGIELY